MKKSIQSIPAIFENRFPDNFINNVIGWGIPKDELHTKLSDGTYKLLSIDIDFGLACSLKCPHCFQNNQNSYNFKNNLSWDETIDVINQAESLGLKYVKILGAGEPFEERSLLRFVEELSRRNIHTAIFTKGHVLGSDELTKRYFGHEGIETAEKLVERLYQLKTSILLGFNSFDENKQLEFVGLNSIHPLKNYAELRNNALNLLTEVGFNKFIPGMATRLAIVAAPFKPENINEILDIYKWGMVRNIYVASCPTTSSGNGNMELIRESKNDFNSYIEAVKKLYIEIYSWAISKGAVRKDDFIEQGVSLYPGVHPCNQVAAGFYIRLDGSIYICPGNDNNNFLINQDIRGKDLKNLWINSANYSMAKEKRFNFGCVAREDSFFKEHPDFYSDVYHETLKLIETSMSK